MDPDHRFSDEPSSAERQSNILPEQHELIEKSILASVRRDPRPLADALYPVMGLAIRKASAATLAAMTESLNRTIDRTFSWQALKWRWQAFRSGKPFAEIVLLNTLSYRVEELFLIHANTGLLLQHVSAGDVPRDADIVSGMLTAIRDFVGDSFRRGTDSGDSLEAIRLGELTLLIEPGPLAILAAVIRGNLPPDLRVKFQDALEAIHRRQGLELQAFDGDSAPFARSRGFLEACLISEFRRQERTRSSLRLAVLAIAVLATLGARIISDVRERRQWDDYLARLDAEPGIVVVSSGWRNGRFVVVGLRDPLAQDPGMLLDPPLSYQLDARWNHYQAVEPEFVVTRATRVLRPPVGVTLEFQEGTLVARGPAPERWIVDSERLALALPGVSSFTHAGASADIRLKESIESISIEGVGPEQRPQIQQLIQLLDELNETMRLRGSMARVDVVAEIDANGAADRNARLSRGRAETLVRMLPTATLDALEISARGTSNRGPNVTTTAAIPSSKRLSIYVELPGKDRRRRADR